MPFSGHLARLRPGSRKFPARSRHSEGTDRRNGRKCSARKIQRSRLLSRDGKVLTFDLESFFGRRNFRDIAVLYNEFESDRDQLIPVGFSADWWMEITLNGKLVYTTMKTGNEKKNISSQ